MSRIKYCVPRIHWHRAIIDRLEQLRLVVHPGAQVAPVKNGIPWLGFIVFPDYRRVKSRNVRNFQHRLHERWDAFCAEEISFAEFDSSVQAWINHVRYADTWGLRREILGKPLKNTRIEISHKNRD